MGRRPKENTELDEGNRADLIVAAKELCYPVSVIKKLEAAKTMPEALRIMATARHELIERDLERERSKKGGK